MPEVKVPSHMRGKMEYEHRHADGTLVSRGYAYQDWRKRVHVVQMDAHGCRATEIILSGEGKVLKKIEGDWSRSQKMFRRVKSCLNRLGGKTDGNSN